MAESLLTKLTDNNLTTKDDEYRITSQTHELMSELIMPLTSYIRMTNIEDLQLINSSILNYGINEKLDESNNIEDFLLSIEIVIAKFEPRLRQVSIECTKSTAQRFEFKINGLYHTTPVVVDVYWDRLKKQFFINE